MFQLVGQHLGAQASDSPDHTRQPVTNASMNATVRAADGRGVRGLRRAPALFEPPQQRGVRNPRLPPIGSKRPRHGVPFQATATSADPQQPSHMTPYQKYQHFARAAPTSVGPVGQSRQRGVQRRGGQRPRPPPPASRAREKHAAPNPRDKYTVKFGVPKKPVSKPKHQLEPINPSAPPVIESAEAAAAPQVSTAPERARISVKTASADRGSLTEAQVGYVLPVLARFLQMTEQRQNDPTKPADTVVEAMTDAQRTRHWSLCRVKFFSKAPSKRRASEKQDEGPEEEDEEGTYVGLTELAARVALPNPEEHDALLADAQFAYRRARFKYTLLDSRLSCWSARSSIGSGVPMPMYRPPSAQSVPDTDGPRRRGAVIEEGSDDDSRPSSAASIKNTAYNLQQLELPEEGADWGFSQGTVGPDLQAVLENLNPHESSPMDFLGKMCILPDWKLHIYRTVFEALIKGHNTETLTPVHLCRGLRAICGHELKDVEIDFVAELLDLARKDRSNGVTFEEFAMAAALAEHIPALEEDVRGKINPAVLERKKRKAMLMFFIDAEQDCTLRLEDLESLLDAGRVVEEQKRSIIDRLAQHGQSITFMEYLAYLPLFVDIHRDIVTHTFEDEKRHFDDVDETS